MGKTPFFDVYEYAFTEIDDVRMSTLMDENPALFLSRCWEYLRNAIPLFTSPKGMQDKLKDYVEPTYSEQHFNGDGTETTFNGEPDMDYVIVSVDTIVKAVIDTTDAEGETVTVNGITYNITTGEITFTEAPQGSIFVDYNTNGYFNAELNHDEIAILAKCFSVVWFNKNANTFLRTTPKIKDKNFNTDSSFGVEQADTAKLRSMRIELHDMMAQYENSLAYKSVVPISSQLLNRV